MGRNETAKRIGGKTAFQLFELAYKSEDPTQMVEYYSRVLELDPKNVKAWYNKGFALDELKRYEEAVDAYRKAIEIDPKDAAAWNNK